MLCLEILPHVRSVKTSNKNNMSKQPLAEKEAVEAIKDMICRHNTDGDAIGLLAARAACHVSTHFEKLKEIAEDPENEGEVKFSLSCILLFGGVTPSGSVKLSFNVKTEDESTFTVEDPQQGKLEIEK